MKFKIHVKDSTSDWWEDYDKSIADPKKYAEEIISRFNATLRAHETPRELIEVQLIDPDNKKFHDWQKRTDGMSVNFRGSTVDLMYCKKCGITGKRFGISENVKIDSKYRKKAFQECHTSLIEQAKSN